MSKPTLTVDELKNLRRHLREFEFAEVMNVLGWNRASGTQPPLTVEGQVFRLTTIARLGGVQVIEVTGGDDPASLPLDTLRRKVSDEVLKTVREHVLIFVDSARTQSHWYWVKREIGEGNKRKAQTRTHTYLKGQPDDNFVNKLSGLFVDIGELNEEGDLSVTEAALRLSRALDSSSKVNEFYKDFKTIREDFASQIGGISDERDRAWYASVILNRLMFVYFLQGKGFLGRPTARSDGDRTYLQTHMAESKKRGADRYYSEFLRVLFFDAFAVPEDQRSDATNVLVGQIPYLNGGLFLKHGIELTYSESPHPGITIPDRAFDQILGLFQQYNWNLSDDEKHRDGLDPDVLGHIFEKYINQKGFGAYYTRPEITEYLCEQTVEKLVLDKIRERRPGAGRQNENLNDAIANADVNLVRSLLTADDGLKEISLLDPACGSGAFLVAALKTMLNIYTGLMQHIDKTNDPTLTTWRKELRGRHENPHYNLKKKIITENLYGVDLMEEAAEIAKLRLFLSLVGSANDLDDLEPLPNIDFNILAGNSLVGLLEVDEKAYNTQRELQINKEREKEQARTTGVVNKPTAKITGLPPMLGVGEKTYRQVVEEYQREVSKYRANVALGIKNLTALREGIRRQKETAYETLNALLHKQFHDFGIKFEQASWDDAKGQVGRSTKRALTLDDITWLKPFHWAFEFAEVMGRGGFDAVITNPPWDVWQTDEKEFFQQYEAGIQKNKIRIEDWKKQQAELMKDVALRKAWLDYASRFSYTSAYFKKAPQFIYNISYVNGRNVGSKINLYTYFLEQSFRLLKKGGECGIVIPSGIYTDLGAKGLREMLFNQTQITGLFCFENGSSQGVIFENVHRSFKFVVLSFRKGGRTRTFPAAFMRHDVRDFKNFPDGLGLNIDVGTIRKMSPDSLSIMEFKNELDAQIAEKMSNFSLLGEHLGGTWNLKLSSEFNMTTDSHLFKALPGPGRLPLYEGKMIHQFRHDFAGPRYWVEEAGGRKGVLSRQKDVGQKLGYQGYRLGHRAIARNTDSRTMIATILPKNVFFGHSINASKEEGNTELLYLAAVLNSMTFDYALRQSVTANLTMFFIYQVPVPRLTAADLEFQPIVAAAARLVCTTPEFDDLARAAGLSGHQDGMTDGAGRAALRAELDARVAHLYGLTEDEFKHILSTFPLVDQAAKAAAQAEFKRLAPPEGDPDLVRLVQGGESDRLEFKSSLRVALDPSRPMSEKEMEQIILKEVAAFLNSQGGTLLIGVSDDGRGLGLGPDYASFKQPKDRNADGFWRHLHTQVGNALGQVTAAALGVSFPVLDSQEICRVEVPKGTEPSFLEVTDKNGANKRHVFYLRVGNKVEELVAGPQQVRYVRERWA